MNSTRKHQKTMVPNTEWLPKNCGSQLGRMFRSRGFASGDGPRPLTATRPCSPFSDRQQLGRRKAQLQRSHLDSGLESKLKGRTSSITIWSNGYLQYSKPPSDQWLTELVAEKTHTYFSARRNARYTPEFVCLCVSVNFDVPVLTSVSITNWNKCQMLISFQSDVIPTILAIPLYLVSSYSRFQVYPRNSLFMTKTKVVCERISVNSQEKRQQESLAAKSTFLSQY